MTVKESVQQVLASLPDDSTLDDVIHALYVRAKFERGESEIRAGKGVDHDQAKQRLHKWAG